MSDVAIELISDADSDIGSVLVVERLYKHLGCELHPVNVRIHVCSRVPLESAERDPDEVPLLVA